MELPTLNNNIYRYIYISLIIIFMSILLGCGSSKTMNVMNMMALMPPANHGLSAEEITVEAGMSKVHGNVEVSCPAGGSACTIAVADDGSVSYSTGGGMPTVAPASVPLSSPMNHGLSAVEFSVEPGMSETRGNVEVSCSSGDNACTVTVTDDGSMNYSATGGIPTIMLVRAPLDLPSNHDLSSGEFTVEAGMTEAHGNVEVSCPSGDTACTVTVTADGMAVYGLSGSMPTFALLPVRQVRPGLSKSLNEPVHSNDANDIPFDQLILNSNNVFAPITTALDRISGDPSTVTSSDTAIKAISGDGDGGYYVTFVIDGEEWTQHYTKEHYSPDDSGFFEFESKPEDNAPYYNIIWFEHTGFTYFNVFGGVSGSLDPNIRPRFYFIAGVKTENLPNGTAEYVGDMYGQIWRSDDQSDRTRVIGVGVLRADFEQSTVNGEISNIRVRPQNSDSYSSLEDNKFMIETGNITNSQFVANLIGTDSTSGSSGTQHSNEVISSIQGFDGNVLGEFYGPQANEVGAVLNASRGDSVLFGYLTGKQFTDTLNPTVPEGKLSEPLFATIKRDFGENMSATLTDETGVKSIQSDEERGFVLTYVVDGGEPQEVHLQASDFDHAEGLYHKFTELGEFYLWTDSDFIESVEFEYFDPYSFVFNHGDGVWPWSVFVSGVQTDLDDLPSGTATYQGLMQAHVWKGPDRRSQRTSIRGSLNLTADFGESTVQGRVDNVNLTRPGDNEYLPLSDTDQFVIENSVFENNQFTADLRGEDSNALAPLDESVRGIEGSIVGQFFGPAAEEVGGILKATRTEDNSEVQGWFGGDRE